MLLALAFGCLVASVVAMRFAFAKLAESTTTTSPSDLAQGISVATVPAIITVLLAILGIVLVVTGLVVRQRFDRAQ